MPFDRPTLAGLRARARADMLAIPGAEAPLRRAATAVLADVGAGAAHQLHGHLAWAARQILASFAEAEFLGAQGREWIGARLPASRAAGVLLLAGANGAVAPAGTIWRRADGAEYALDADATIVSGAASAAITCSTYGAIGNDDAGAALTILSPIAGINSAAVIDSGGLSGGADTESDESYRARVLARKRAPPDTGTRADYIRWALEVPGVTRAWCSAELGPGSVVVRFVRDGDPSIYPNDSAIAATLAYIQSQAPYPADISCAAPLPQAVDFTLWISPSTAAVREAVAADLAGLVYRSAAPGSILLISDIGETVGLAAGVADWRLISPASDVAFDVAHIGEMGSITWT
jgi:uncharacterized phage protein gp47/JayE